MYCRKLPLVSKEGLRLGSTPMLVPSISSRLNLNMHNLVNDISAIVDGALLVSAYDLKVLKNVVWSFPSLIFLDSGGYECSKEQDVAEMELYNVEPRDWAQNDYKDAIDSWTCPLPTVLISFDHPNIRLPISEQIANARSLFRGKDRYLKEMLIKPESPEHDFVEPERVIGHIAQMRYFDIIGFTEKELGDSIIDRMVNIARIREGMDSAGLKVPIHIFGSLDTVTTPLYFFAGADIFDGLSWLRFMYHSCDTMYRDSYGPKIFSPATSYYKIWVQSIYHNHSYLIQLENNLKKFVSTDYKNFSLFGGNSEFFERTVEDFTEKMRRE